MSAPSTDLAVVGADPIKALPTERLEAGITELAAHIHAATARWLVMVAEFDRRQAWADWDCKSCAHWISWRCGLGIRAAQDHVRVARSLLDLPTITSEFEAGHFSFTQVRALTRVATSDNEAELVELARRAPAAQLEGMVRAFRGAVRAQELDDATRRQLTRHLTYYYDDDGSFVINARLSPEEGAVVEKALEAMERELADDELEEDGRSAERFEDDLAGEVIRELADDAFGYTEDLNHQEQARDKFYASQASNEWSRRHADCLVALAENALRSSPKVYSNPDRYQVVAHVDIGALVDDDLDARSELDQGPALPPEILRRLSCDCDIVTMLERDGEILSVGRKTRKIPRRIRRALHARDRHCRFPGCTSKVWVDGHHIEHWVRDGGETKLSNLCLLCRAHHRAVHEYGYRIELDGDNIAFYRPDGTPIAAPEPLTSHPDAVVDLNRKLGLEIDPETSVPEWFGDKWDHDVTVRNLVLDHGFD